MKLQLVKLRRTLRWSKCYSNANFVCKIVWDERTTTHKNSLEALDRMMQDLRNNQDRFGGAMILLAGDFRQTLPVIPRSTLADEFSACLKSSVLWKNVITLKLCMDMC